MNTHASLKPTDAAADGVGRRAHHEPGEAVLSISGRRTSATLTDQRSGHAFAIVTLATAEVSSIRT